MIDESMDTEAMKKPPQPWELRSRPAWQRLIVMAGGVIMNVILAIVLYIAILFTWGEQYIRTSDAVYGIEVSPLAREIGFATETAYWRSMENRHRIIFQKYKLTCSASRSAVSQSCAEMIPWT